MKDRLAYSPRDFKFASKTTSQLNKSPTNEDIRDSANFSQDIGFRYPQLRTPQSKQFENIKKISEESSTLRQTMNHKVSDRLNRKMTADLQLDKPNKFNDLLRSTVGPKNSKVYSQRLIPENSFNSREVYIKPEFNGQSLRGYQNFPTAESGRMMGETKPGVNLLQNSRSYKQYQKLSEKIDRNKKIIQELRKTTGHGKEDRDYLKHVNHTKSPTYIDLDHQKQTQDYGFRKKKKDQAELYLTPQVDKGSYDSRFNSSPLIEISKSSERLAGESVISGGHSAIKKKVSSQFHGKGLNILQQFEQGRKLGQGKFGCVNIVRHKRTGGVFALKKIPKALIKSHMMVQQLALQIRLQSCLNHRNILGMHGFFDDKTHLYIILEYMDGGTLYQKLKKGKQLNQHETAVVIKQMTLAIDYLHDLGIAHRDIKPQNIVVSNNVFKLCDFGWAAMCNERRKTYCGTFDYVAPQILEGVDYDMTVDLWCLGVLTYELMTGKAPFYHISRKQTMKKILNVQNENIVYPQGMSEKAKDFIDRLVRKNPAERIKASQALMHPFLDVAELDL